MSQKANAQKPRRRKAHRRKAAPEARPVETRTEDRVRFERSRIAIGVVLGILMVLSILMPLVYALM